MGKDWDYGGLEWRDWDNEGQGWGGTGIGKNWNRGTEIMRDGKGMRL